MKTFVSRDYPIIKSGNPVISRVVPVKSMDDPVKSTDDLAMLKVWMILL